VLVSEYLIGGTEQRQIANEEQKLISELPHHCAGLAVESTEGKQGAENVKQLRLIVLGEPLQYRTASQRQQIQQNKPAA